MKIFFFNFVPYFVFGGFEDLRNVPAGDCEYIVKLHFKCH